MTANRLASPGAFQICLVLILASAGAVGSSVTWAADVHRAAAAPPRFKAIAFDFLVLFNPDSVVPEVERVFPGKGRQLTNLWRTRQFEYSWLRSITDRYVDFFTVTEDALVYAASAMNVLFAAFGGWDAAGAKAFGYPTFWVNRFNQPLEELGVRPDGISANLKGLIDFALSEHPGIFLPGAGYMAIDVRKPLSGAAEMNRTIVGACVALTLTAAVGAQDKKMAMEKMDHMAMQKAYSGCVESSQTGSFTLTHSMIAVSKNSMKKADAMEKDDPMMKTDSMKTDHAMAHDTMAPESLALSAAAGVNLRKHVGHKVTVTGTDGDSMSGMATFKVTSIKKIGGSCS